MKKKRIDPNDVPPLGALLDECVIRLKEFLDECENVRDLSIITSTLLELHTKQQKQIDKADYASQDTDALIAEYNKLKSEGL